MKARSLASITAVTFLVFVWGRPLPQVSNENLDTKRAPSNTTDTQFRTASFRVNTGSTLGAKLDRALIMDLAEQRSGERTSAALQSELHELTGDGEPLKPWVGKAAKETFRLVRVTSYLRNLDSGLELLFNHQLMGAHHVEQSYTRFTHRIREADEKTIQSSLVLSRSLEIQDGKPVFEDDSRLQYFFSLKPHAFGDSFSLNAPEGQGKFTEVRTGSFDPLAILQKDDAAIGPGEFQNEIRVGAESYDVQAFLRTQTIKSTKLLTIEVAVRQVNSLVKKTFVLVYESTSPKNTIMARSN